MGRRRLDRARREHQASEEDWARTILYDLFAIDHELREGESRPSGKVLGNVQRSSCSRASYAPHSDDCSRPEVRIEEE